MSEDFEFKAFLIFQRNKYGSNRLEEKSNILGRVGKMTLRFFCFGFFLFVCLAAPMAYGNFQARG